MSDELVEDSGRRYAAPETRRARRFRVARLDPQDPVELFELRDAFVVDPDASVRTAAILRLNASGAEQLVPYLREACRDPAMAVREAAFVGLGRARDGAAAALAIEACRYDRGFRVRRMALLAAARLGETRALPVLALASRDPFWRVRRAARRVALALSAGVDTSPIALDLPGMDFLDLDDPDPAVITARLARVRAGLELRALVGALGHSHRALRAVAVKALGQQGNLATLRSALAWFTDERVPYGPAAAEAALARSPHSDALAAQVLSEAIEPPAGALAWAIRRASLGPSWARTEAALTHEDARVCRAAVRRVPDTAPDRTALFAALRGALETGDDNCRTFAASWLVNTRSRDAKRLLEGLDPAKQPAPVRRLMVGVWAEARAITELRAFTRDAHGGVRAAAFAALSQLGALDSAERRELGSDLDPWIRQATLNAERAPVATRDPALAVRRIAVSLLHDSAARTAWAVGAAAEPDPCLRARAATILAELGDERAIGSLLQLFRDRDPGVRSAAVAALAGRREVVRGLLEAGGLQVNERIAAHTLLNLERPDGEGADPPFGSRETDPRVLAHLALLNAVVEGRIPPLPSPPAVPERAAPPHERRLGKTNLRVQPFALSGAYALSYDDFALAEARGVNLFFWEPPHHELTRFLRARSGSRALVVAGTYHADPDAIERDVKRALRALRRDTLDVFLAFWTRSAARLAEVTDVLRDCVKQGLIRAAGVSTHDRALACDAAARGLDVVMIRHNAAHRGAESSLFPECVRQGTGVLTFSNLCYGRMLHRTPAALSAPVTAPECYRYSLSQPGVHACIAAPRRHSELIENLAVLDDPVLSPTRQAELRAHGDHVYARSKAWSAETWPAPPPRAQGELPPRSGVGVVAESLEDWIEHPESIAADSW